MKDELKGKHFQELKDYEGFAAQTSLEADMESDYLKQIFTIQLEGQNVSLHYSRLRGAIEAIRSLRQRRDHLIEFARSKARSS